MQNTSNIARQTFLTALSILLLSAFVGTAHAQPSSFDHPIALDSLTLRGSLNGGDNERYYSFMAGTSQTELLFEVKASGDNAGATFDLFDKQSRAIVSNVFVQSVNHSTERQTETFQLGRQQEVILRVKGMRYGSSGGQGSFMVRIGTATDRVVPRKTNDLEKKRRKQPRADQTENDEAQHSDWDHPILVEINDWRDALDGSDEEKYFVFIAAPGTLKILFEVQAAGDNAGATFDLFDTKHRALLSNVFVQSVHKGTERAQQSIRIGREQKLILRVKGMRYGSTGGQGVYRVRLSAQ